MKIQRVNPWTWQDAYGFSQALDVSDAQRLILCSGQTSVGPDGHPLHAGDMAAQVAQAFDNLEAVLARAGLTLKDVVRLNYYTTNVPAFMEAMGAVGERLARAQCLPASTLLGVAALFHPDILVEIEATAAR